MTQNTGGLSAGTALLTRLTALAQTDIEARVDRVDVTARAVALDPQLLDDLLAASSHGHSVHLQFTSGTWALEINVTPGSPAVLDESGETSDALSGAAYNEFDAAVARNDARDAALIAATVSTADVRLSICNDPDSSGFHWIRSTRDLLDLLTGSRWVAATNSLSTGPTRLVVADAGDAHLQTDTLNLVGPGRTNADAPPSETRVISTGPGNHHPSLPAPQLAGRPRILHDPDNQLTPLCPALHEVARRLAWARIASSATIETDGTLALTISGARVVQVRIPASVTATDSATDLDLYEWTFATDDLARYESTVHAASLAILEDSDLPTAATPTARTAKSLYQLAKSGAVAEALATRRAAREAMQESARAAATTAREVSGKATERCLIQAGAAAAVVLTNSGDLINSTSGYWLIGLIALLGITSLLVALCVELRSGRDALAGGLDDLDEYRETIPQAEIADMRNRSKARQSAEADLRRATWWTAIVYGVTILALTIVGATLIHLHTTDKSKSPAKKNAAAVAEQTTTIPTGSSAGTSSEGRNISTCDPRTGRCLDVTDRRDR